MITKEQFDNLKVGDTVLYADKMEVESYGMPGTVTAKFSNNHIIVLFSTKFPQAFEFTEKFACKWLDLPNE